MNRSELSAERARELLNYDPATGLLTWKVGRSHKTPAGSPAGSLSKQGYVCVKVGGVLYKAHRLAWLLLTGGWPSQFLDHINGVKSDNRACNLREIGRAGNAENLHRARVDSKTGLLGVSRDGFKFRATIQASRRLHYLGAYQTPEEAHQAYLTAKRQLHAGCMI
jgi:hypothetical protein